MNAEDLDNATDGHQAGVLSLKAAVWALARYRAQYGREVTATEVMERFGSSRTAAYRAIAEVSPLVPVPSHAVPEIGTACPEKRDDLSRKSGLEIPEIGTESPGNRNKQSRISGQTVPEIGTNRPGNRDCNNDKGLRDLERACSSRPHAREEPVSESEPEPDPVPEADPFAVPPPVAHLEPDPPEHRKLHDLADQLSGGTLGRWASDMLKLEFPVHHVRAVIEKKIAGARPMPHPSLLTSILQRWARGEGSDIPPDPATVAKRNAPPEYYRARRTSAVPTRRTTHE